MFTPELRPSNDRNFILTTYMTDKIKMGEKYEIQKK